MADEGKAISATAFTPPAPEGLIDVMKADREPLGGACSIRLDDEGGEEMGKDARVEATL